MSRETVLLTGATGTAGRATARALLEAGHRVVAYGRRDPVLPGVTFASGAVTRPAEIAEALARHRPQALVSCLASRTGGAVDAWAIDHGAQLCLLRGAEAAGVSHFVLLSAICLQKPRLPFQHAKLAFEAELVASPLRHSIVRPTALFKSLSGQIERLRRGRPYLMVGDGRLTACKPIGDADLGRFIASCLDTPARQNAILPVGGPGPALTPREMGAALFAALGRPPRYRTVSPAMLQIIAGGLGLAGRFNRRLAAKAELARIGHYYATESMLHWDAARQRYDAEATPEYGSQTLAEHYAALAAGRATATLGDHAVF
jgi:divinyl chlorophyllide a 8-vinyl-reductase